MNSGTALPSIPIQHCELVKATPHIPLVKKTLPDGSVFHYDKDEYCVIAQYASGVQVIKNEKSIFVRSADGSHWFGYQGNRWFRLN